MLARSALNLAVPVPCASARARMHAASLSAVSFTAASTARDLKLSQSKKQALILKLQLTCKRKLKGKLLAERVANAAEALKLPVVYRATIQNQPRTLKLLVAEANKWLLPGEDFIEFLFTLDNPPAQGLYIGNLVLMAFSMAAQTDQ